MIGTSVAAIDCPYCGERIEIVVDCSVDDQEYVEDCAVCCRPITIGTTVDADGDVYVTARTENGD
ncbi:MAG TPA: CPXCG motif-containing cysteine-rich protein [Pseudomonadales bacterium]|nr:CPXCG motif-containing cysteine-rich protein [Pseudomonadales bacterium]